MSNHVSRLTRIIVNARSTRIRLVLASRVRQCVKVSLVKDARDCIGMHVRGAFSGEGEAAFHYL